MNRTEHSMRNLRYALVFQTLALLTAFFTRRVFVSILTKEYLGLDGTFANLLVALSLAELGLGEAITFSLYKPIAEHKIEKLRSLMALYRRAYQVVGLVVALLAGVLACFLPQLIRDFPDLPHIYLIYALFVVNSVLPYFFSYKQSLILADQQRYVITAWRYGLWTLLYLLQALFLWVTHAYLVYLLLQILETFLENWILARRADHLYPFLHSKKAVQPLDEETRQTVVRNTKAMFLHKLGGILVFNTDNLLISYFFGVIAVGLYSNYLLIEKGLRNCYKMVFGAFLGSVGNLGATEGKEEAFRIYRLMNFAGSWLIGFCSICLIVLFNPFLELWVGQDYLFPLEIVGLIVLNFYATGMREVNQTFQNAYGLFSHMRYKSLVESAINLVVSIALAQWMGIAGIFVGTLISTVLTCFWVEPYILFRYAFEQPLSNYFIQYMIHTVLTGVVGWITWMLCGLLPGSGMIPFLWKAVLCITVPNLLFLLAFWKTEELTEFRRRLGTLLS